MTRQSSAVPVLLSPYYLRQYQHSSLYRISQMSPWNNVACNLPIPHVQEINQTNLYTDISKRRIIHPSVPGTDANGEGLRNLFCTREVNDVVKSESEGL